MSTELEKIIDDKIFVLLNDVHDKYPETSIDEMKNMWRNQEFTLTYDKQEELKNKQCQYMYIKGKS
jgi:hypothetical protein